MAPWSSGEIRRFRWSWVPRGSPASTYRTHCPRRSEPLSEVSGIEHRQQLPWPRGVAVHVCSWKLKIGGWKRPIRRLHAAGWSARLARRARPKRVTMRRSTTKSSTVCRPGRHPTRQGKPWPHQLSPLQGRRSPPGCPAFRPHVLSRHLPRPGLQISCIVVRRRWRVRKSAFAATIDGAQESIRAAVVGAKAKHPRSDTSITPFAHIDLSDGLADPELADWLDVQFVLRSGGARLEEDAAGCSTASSSAAVPVDTTVLAQVCPRMQLPLLEAPAAGLLER